MTKGKLSTSVDVVDAMNGWTIHVDFKRVNELKRRMWLGAKLFYLAALVMNCNIKLDEEVTD